jgi:hypothetical protein
VVCQLGTEVAHVADHRITLLGAVHRLPVLDPAKHLADFSVVGLLYDHKVKLVEFKLLPRIHVQVLVLLASDLARVFLAQRADFRRAAGLDRGAVQAQQKRQQSAATGDCQQVTSKEQTNEKAPENRGDVAARQTVTTAVEDGSWAIQDSNL